MSFTALLDRLSEFRRGGRNHGRLHGCRRRLIIARSGVRFSARRASMPASPCIWRWARRWPLIVGDGDLLRLGGAFPEGSIHRPVHGSAVRVHVGAVAGVQRTTPASPQPRVPPFAPAAACPQRRVAFNQRAGQTAPAVLHRRSRHTSSVPRLYAHLCRHLRRRRLGPSSLPAGATGFCDVARFLGIVIAVFFCP